MTFTDEQLNRFKSQPSKAIGLSKRTFLSLIARLEAAEYALLRLSITNHVWTLGMEEAVKKWKEKAGRRP